MGPYHKLGCIGKATRPTDTLQGKKFTEENTSWQPRKRLRRRKRNTNRLARRNLAKNPRDLKKASLEKHLRRGFFFSSSVASRWSLAKSQKSTICALFRKSHPSLRIKQKDARQSPAFYRQVARSLARQEVFSDDQRRATNDKRRRQPPAAYGTKMGLFTARHSARNGCVRNSGLPANPQGTSKQAA